MTQPGTPPSLPPDVVAAVVGQSALRVTLIVRLLSTLGVRVAQSDSRRGPSVALLLDGQPATWARLRGLGVPALLLEPAEGLDAGESVEAVLRGADGFVSEDSAPEELVDALATVAGGGTVVGPRSGRALVTALRVRADQGLLAPPTPRELDVLLGIARGDSIKQTARALGISPKTVESLQTGLFRKLGVRNRAQAVTRAHALGLVGS